MNKKSILVRLFVFVAVALLLLFPATPVFAQSAGTGTINGTVTDTSGAVVPNAEVVIKNTDTGAERTLTTNPDGYFIAPAMQSGNYEVTLGGGAFGSPDLAFRWLWHVTTALTNAVSA